MNPDSCNDNVIERRMRGDTFSYEVQVVNYDQDTDTETPIDITGYKFWLSIKSKLNDSDDDVVAQAIKEDPHTDPLAGITVLSIPASVMKGLSGEYYFDVQMKDTTELDDEEGITTLVTGVLEIRDDVTQAIE
jgi:hypothetical protein